MKIVILIGSDWAVPNELEKCKLVKFSKRILDKVESCMLTTAQVLD